MMGRHARQVEQSRAERDAARELFDTQLALIREELAERGIGGRIADKVGHDTREAIDEAIAVADANRGVIAGTIAALAVWLLRRPILSWLEKLLGVDLPGGDIGEQSDEN